jgi:hypothetical protein
MSANNSRCESGATRGTPWDDAVELIVCDGPGATEIEASNVFEFANAIVAGDGDGDIEATTLDQLAELGFGPSARVRFETNSEAMRKSA